MSSDVSLEDEISLASKEFDTGILIAAPTPAPTSKAITVTTINSVINCIVNKLFFIPIVLRTPISYFLSLIFIMLITNNTTPPITKVIIKKVVAKLATLETPDVALSTSSKFVETT